MKTLIVLICLLLPSMAWAKLNVFACEPEWASLTQQLGGERVNVYSATTAQQDPHHVEARPSLIAKIRNADLVVCSGAELETGWLPLLLRRSGNPAVQTRQPGYFEAAMQVERLEIPKALDRSMGDVHGAGSPHVHLDPNRLHTIAEKLSQRLALIDEANAAAYQAQWQEFSQQWRRKISQWEQQAIKLSGKKVVVYHQDWVYLNHWLGIQRVATIEPRPGVPPSAADQKRLLEQLQTQPADAIVIAAYQNDKAARWLADKTGLPVIQLPYTVGGDEQSTDLTALMDRTVTLLNGIQW